MRVKHTYKLSVNRGNKRIWIEGNRLSNAGFKQHDVISATLKDDKLIIAVNPDGDRKVSGRQRKGQTKVIPIIDICSSEISDAIGSATHIDAVFTDKKIVVTW